MKFLRLLESWKFRKFSWPPVTLPVRIKYKYCKSTNLEILNTVQGQRRATSLLLKWSRIQFQNSISDSEMHTLWFKSSLFNLGFIDQSEFGTNTDNLTSVWIHGWISCTKDLWDGLKKLVLVQYFCGQVVLVSPLQCSRTIRSVQGSLAPSQTQMNRGRTFG